MNFTEFYLQEDITDNPNFKKWFGNSKVIDKNGNPLVMYHGSYYDFNEFDKNKRGQSGTLAAKKAFWFTSSLNHATNFSGGSDNLVKAVYLKLDNPIVYDAKDIPGWNTQWLHTVRNEKVQTAIRKGKNGVIFKNMHDLGGPFTIVAVFEPNQIKSINNNGEFNPNSDNINEIDNYDASSMIRLYRGMQREFNPNHDLSDTDAPHGYSTWTDNIELAKQYAGKNGYIYQIDLPKKEMGEELIDNDGERSLFVNNKKPAGLNNISGDEYLVYTAHDLYNSNDIKLVKEK